MPIRNPELLSRHDSRLLIVDMQQKLVPVIHENAGVLANCLKLVQAAKILGTPVFATEQYPKGLGETVPELASLIESRPSKLRFSSSECLGWETCPAGDPRPKIVVAGIETHVCVQQTVFDLLAGGFLVYVAADAVGSRKPLDRDWALQRMQAFGAVITTTEAILFEWCEVAGTDEFKQISRLVTGR
jgi:nicotinamidase-related amidase